MTVPYFYLVELGGDAVKLRVHTGVALLRGTQCLGGLGKVSLVLLQLALQFFLCISEKEKDKGKEH